MIIFRRKIYDKISEWKEHYGGKYALLIEGARRVGKTTAVKQFVENEYRSSIIIDFSKADKEIKDLFRHHAEDLDRFFLYLQQMYKTVLYERESAVVFDEVQLFPLARQMIKHLVADGRYDYIETGSLLSIKQNVCDILIPSEEMSISMHPMDFEEFLWAQKDEVTVPLLRKAFEDRVPLGPGMHKRIMDTYSIHMLVGGMPQSVEAYLEKKNFEAVETVKRMILKLYADDTSKIKIDRGSKSKRILFMIPSFLSKHKKTFSPSQLRKGSKTREYFDSITWLNESKIVNMCYRNSDPSPALNLNLDEHTFKIYMADTGLLITASFNSNVGDRDEIYRDILNNRMKINRGMFFENMIAQELVSTGHRLVFSKFSAEDSANMQEVDFIIADGRKMIPIEAKSGVSNRHASLDRFMDRFSSAMDIGYVVHSKNLRADGNLVYIPIYMTMFL
ncbi:MAG: AAA family ATPase [Methanomassiliicoccaceae archaeon]|nr:AAA family ATPase [Methanomassiliicoccaceae archaeon]